MLGDWLSPALAANFQMWRPVPTIFTSVISRSQLRSAMWEMLSHCGHSSLPHHASQSEHQASQSEHQASQKEHRASQREHQAGTHAPALFFSLCVTISRHSISSPRPDQQERYESDMGVIQQASQTKGNIFQNTPQICSGCLEP